jgi:predicted dehydrogenase
MISVGVMADVDAAAARAVEERIGATVHDSGEELIADDAVDAVVVCSWGPTHEQYALASIATGKPVFREKPHDPSRTTARGDVHETSRPCPGVAHWKSYPNDRVARP